MARLFRRRFRRVLVDVDTQYDLLCNGEPELSSLVRQFRRLIAWARVHNIPVISTALSRPSSPSNVTPPGAPSACAEGSSGQRKISYTVLPSHVRFGPENRLDLPRNILADYQQVIFEKRLDDPFTQPRADRLLTHLKIDEFIVFGVGVEKAVKATVLGLLSRRKHVLVVTDAVKGFEKRDTILALRQMETKGAQLTTTAELTGISRLVGRAFSKTLHPSLFTPTQ